MDKSNLLKEIVSWSEDYSSSKFSLKYFHELENTILYIQNMESENGENAVKKKKEVQSIDILLVLSNNNSIYDTCLLRRYSLWFLLLSSMSLLG